MAVVPVVHRDAAVRTAIRRGLPRHGVKVMTCRSVERVVDVLQRELVDAIVVDVRTQGPEPTLALACLYPGIPVFALSAFRPDDGPLISRCMNAGLRGILVEGVDDAVAGELIAARSASRMRRVALRNAPRLLRLTEPVQLKAWNEVLAHVGTAARTSDIAQGLQLTREHLSREFAAGGAPNLKRVIDLVRAAWAADLLRNPGYTTRTVSAILRYSSPSHLADSARRVAGVSPRDLARLGTTGVLQRFLKGRMRSRL